MANRGSVYCIANDAMPGIVKIGATVRDPTDRLSEARAVTWAPTCFRIIAQASVDDALATERALHALLAARRFEARREFFTLTHDEGRALFDTVARVAVGAHHAPRVAPAHQAVSARVARVARVAEVPVSYEEQLRAWVESNYTHIPLRAKDTGTKLESLFSAYTSASPPVHEKMLGRNKFAAMLGVVYHGIGPHRNAAGSVNGLYLLRTAEQ